MKKGIIYTILLTLCCLSSQLSAEMLLTPGDSTILYNGCSGDGYSVEVNGFTYDEANPSGTETLVGAAYSGGDSIVTVNLTFNSNPTPVIIGDNFICSGNCIILDAGVWDSYLWSTPLMETTQTITVCTGGSYTVTVSDTNGCTGETTLTVSEILPFINYIAITETSGTTDDDGVICSGDFAYLEATGADSYIWSDGSTTQSIVVTVAGDYTVTVLDTYGCASTLEATITENPLPIPIPTITETSGTTDNDGIICTGHNAILDVGNFMSYTWSDGTTAQTLTVSTGGTYTVTVTDANGCQATSEFVIIENPLPTPIIVGDMTFCSGFCTTLDVGTYDSYLWLDGSTAQTLEACVSGDYTVTVTDANGCMATATATVTETPAPTPTITGNTIICSGECTSLDPGNGFSAYLWSTGETTQAINICAPGDYTVTIYDFNGCEGIATATITENPIPTPTITGNTSFCTGECTTLDAGIFTAYTWSSGENTQILEACVSGDYTVTVYDSNGCTGTATITIIEDITYGTETYSGCPGDGYEVTVNGITYNEANPIGTEILTSSLGCDSIVDINLMFGNITSTETYEGCSGDGYEVSVNGTIYNEANPTGTEILTSYLGCDSTITVDLVYNSLPTPSIYMSESSGTTNDDGIICDGDNALLDAGAYASYIWSDGASSIQTITVSVPGTYTVTITNVNGCTATAETTIISNPLSNPIITITETSGAADNDGIICDGDNASLDAGLFDAYEWSDGSTSQIINTISIGTYTVTIYDANGCTATAEATISSGNTSGEETYQGCPGDGYSVTVNGTVYDESNPTGIENIPTAGCDSIVTINLDFNCTLPMQEGTFNVCSGTFTDSGGIGIDYQNNENTTTTLCSDNGGAIVVEFTFFDTEGGFDFLTIYDGIDNNAPLIGTYDGDGFLPPTTTSSGTCLTFYFDSDGSVTQPGWEANISCEFGPGTTFGEDNYIGCTGDGYSITLNGVDYNESNPTGTEILVGGSSSGTDSVVYVNLTFNPTSTGTETYSGNEGDGYEVIVNGTPYNEGNPTGVETLINQYGCDSTVTITLNYYPDATEFVNYEGCSGDGYSFNANGVIYDESNPVGTETIPGGAFLGGDSVIVVNLMFSGIEVSITPASPELNCENQSVDLITDVTNPSGNVSYVWSNSESIANINTNVADTYTVTVTDDWGCTSEAEAIVTEAISECVFPGDANYDFVVNSYDHLTVCLAGGDTGPARQTQGINFTAHDADEWNEYVLSNTVDKKHLDCDGNGTIQWADLSAVDLNYNSMHDGTNALRVDGAPSVRLVFQDQYNINEQNNTVVGYIVVDNPETSEDIEALYGILFSIEYDNTFIEEGSLNINYIDDAWLGSSLEVAPLYKDFYDNEQMDLAFTRGDQMSVSGSGVIATVSFIIEDNLIGYTNDYDIPLNVTNVYAHDHLAEEVMFNGESTEVHISIVSSNDNILPEEYIDIYPNPTSGKLVIDTRDLKGESVSLYNALGQLVLEENIQSQQTVLDLDNMSKGIYFLNVRAEEGIVNTKVIVD